MVTISPYLCMDQKSEKATVAAFINGSETAFSELFRKYYPRLLHFTIKTVKSRHDAEEIVQDVFIKLWNIRHKIKTDTSFQAFLFTVTRNMAFDYLKKAVQHDELTEALWTRLELIKNNTEETIFFEEYKRITEKAIQALPPQKQLIFRLSRDEGLTHDQISSQLGISKNTVKNHMIEALKSLKSRLLFSEKLPQNTHLLLFLVFFP